MLIVYVTRLLVREPHLIASPLAGQIRPCIPILYYRALNNSSHAAFPCRVMLVHGLAMTLLVDLPVKHPQTAPLAHSSRLPQLLPAIACVNHVLTAHSQLAPTSSVQPGPRAPLVQTMRWLLLPPPAIE
jgi:hypothetical protein